MCEFPSNHRHQSPADCSEPDCAATVVRAVATIDWSVTGLLSVAGAVILGAFGYFAFWLMQRRPREYRPHVNPVDAANVQGFVPAINRYARRNNIRAWLQDLLQHEADSEDIVLRREVLDQLRAVDGPADRANDIIEQLQRQQVRDERYDDQLLPAFIKPGGNPLFDPANEINPNDFVDQPAILNVNNDRPDHHVVEVEMKKICPRSCRSG
ncbi:unnamed protein product [Allacma fusca]|uniref:Uncharacterized protein n=1 Tax=Allacma fusca TaxID=39272 RepID=A0A8J2KMW8_9HEXA|nr:unnamed protein product [Allacma fusca]